MTNRLPRKVTIIVLTTLLSVSCPAYCSLGDKHAFHSCRNSFPHVATDAADGRPWLVDHSAKHVLGILRYP